MSGKRNRRAGVEDRWTKTVRDPDGTTRTEQSASYGKGSRWRARYVDERRPRAREALRPQGRRPGGGWTSARQRCSRAPTSTRRRRGRRSAGVVRDVARRLRHCAGRFDRAAGPRARRSGSSTSLGLLPLAVVRPSQVRAWCARSWESRATRPSNGLRAARPTDSQIFSDAVHDGVSFRGRRARGGRRPPVRRSSGPTLRRRSRCGRCTTRARRSYARRSCSARSRGCGSRRCAGLRVADVDFMRGWVITPAVQ